MLTSVLRTFASKWLSETVYTKTGGWKSDVRAVKDMLNKVVLSLASYGMPGVITTAPVNSVGTSAATAWKSTAGVAVFRGVVVALAAAETALTATTHDTAQNKQSWYVLSQQTGGTKTITKGADQTIGTDVLPAVPDNEIAIGYMKIVTNAAAGAFDATTDNLAVGTHVASIRWYDLPALATVNIA